MRSTFVLFVLACTSLAACAFDFPEEGEIGFACASDDDCLANFVCRGLSPGATSSGDGLASGSGAAELVGRCAPDDTVGSLCVDDDNDGAFVGPDCTEQILDCDDTNPNVRPGVEDTCDGLDNNCSCSRVDGDTNGDGVICGPGDDGVDEEAQERPCPLQSGACAGAVRACINGEYQDCVADGLYDDRIQASSGDPNLRFEPTEATCDGFDNDCDGNIDESCDCVPGVDPAVECNVDSGPCTRGISVCLSNGTRSGCVEADMGTVCEDGTPCGTSEDCTDGSTCGLELCEDDSTCREGGRCIDEQVSAAESLTDDCGGPDEVTCFRKVCRYLEGDDACTDDAECGDDGLCIEGACQARVILPLATDTCNGIDDNCDGTIDDPFNNPCGPCPFNSELVDILALQRSDFICVDRYEASRPDATETDPGSLELYITSRPGVLPWTGLTAEEAQQACRAEALTAAVGGERFRPIAGKRLCKTFEWRQGCGGKDQSVEEVPYPYSTPGDPFVFRPGLCVDESSGVDGPQPTGSATECCRDSICDAVGNVAEYVTGATNIPQIAGGSYRDSESTVLTCASPDGVGYFPVPEDLTDVGFRCCTQPSSQ